MKRYAINLSLLFIAFACKETPPEPPQPKDPRTYTWTVDTIAYPGSLQTSMRDIWGSSPTDVYIVGHNDQPGPGTMFHYDGARWSTTHFHAAEGGSIAGAVSLSAIYGYGPNDIYAVGERIYQNPIPPPNFLDSSLIIHFEGVQWREAPLPAKGRLLQAISATGPSDLWAGGIYGSLYRQVTGSWHTILSDTLFWFNDFASDGTQIFAVAYYVPPRGGSSTNFLLHWADPRWQVVDSFSYYSGYVATFGNVDLSNIGGALYSAGDGGVFKKSGVGWSKILDSWPYPIYGLGGTRTEHIFAVGESASIYHFNGVDWYKYPQFLQNGVYCSAVWCTETEVFVVGTDGNRTFIYHGR
jgi:hypothetical protein